MRHLNFPKAQPPYNPEEWAGVNPRYSHLLEVPTTAPIELRAQQAGARRWHYLDTSGAGRAGFGADWHDPVRAR